MRQIAYFYEKGKVIIMKKIISFILCLSLAAGMGLPAFADVNVSSNKAHAASIPAMGTITVTVIDEETNEPFTEDRKSFGIVGSPKGMSNGAGGAVYLGGFNPSEKNPCTFENVNTNFSYTIQYSGMDYDGYSYFIDSEKSNQDIIFTDSADIDITVYMKKHVWSENESSILTGDINSDGALNVMDVLRFQKWLTGSSDADTLTISAVDLNKDGKVNIVDLCLLKSILLNPSLIISPSSVPLAEPLKTSYMPGKTVTLKLFTATEHYYNVYVNDEKINLSSSDMEFTVYTFEMPAKDTVIRIESVDVEISDGDSLQL